MNKPREWWIHYGKESIRLKEPHDRVEDHENFIHVIEFSAYEALIKKYEVDGGKCPVCGESFALFGSLDKALEELREVRAQRNESWAVAKELREGNELGALMIMDAKARAARLIEALKHIKLTAMGSTMVQFIRETIDAHEREGK